jgi:hypothetical protein
LVIYLICTIMHGLTNLKNDKVTSRKSSHAPNNCTCCFER